MNKALKDYKCDGQLSIFDYIKEQCSFSGHECNKEELWKVADTLDEIMCPHVCCRKCGTRLCGARCNGAEEPAKEHEHVPPIHRYLRYGPHTLIPEVREETKAWLDRNGVPEWVKWHKDSYPCKNCTWWDGIACRRGFLKTHREYGYLICDNFRQSIVERTTATVGDACPSLKNESKQDTTDDYIREHPTCFYVFGHYLDRESGWHKVPDELPTFTEWTPVDVVLFGKKTGTPWMELDKWEAKDWTFRSLDDRRSMESIEFLAWKNSDDEPQA